MVQSLNSLLLYLLFIGSATAIEWEVQQEETKASICYPDLGCFSNEGDYSNFNLPDSPDALNTRHLLFTSPEQTIDNAEVLLYNDTASIATSSFNSKHATRIISHGFTERIYASWPVKFKDLIFQKETNVNVILVDWERGARAPRYWKAAPNTQVVGAQTAKIIHLLMLEKGAKPANIHLIGLSLGAHVSGFTGKRLQQLTGERPGRITGLDPAGPLFETAPTVARLDKTDAIFVDIIHGNGVPIYSGGFGISKKIGHIDFYPNGGSFQPGCPHAIYDTIQNILDFEFGSLTNSLACNHLRPVFLFMESARQNDCSFVSVPCENYEKFQDGGCTSSKYTNQAAKIGMYVFNAPSEMKQFLLTHGNATEGFCGGSHLKVIIRSSMESVDAKGQFTIRLHDKNGFEDVPLVIAKQEKLLPGRELVELVISRTKISDIKYIELLYERMCYETMCWSDKIRIDSVTLEEVPRLSSYAVKACFRGEVINSNQWSKVETTDFARPCDYST